MKINKLTTKVITVIVAATSLVAVPGNSLASSKAPASTAVSTETGLTSVVLDSGLASALASLKVKLTGLAPSTLSFPAKGTISFPIVGGVFDSASTTTEILHRGGLVFSAGGTSAVLSNFIIEIPGGKGGPVLTGLATVNGALAGRLPLFALDLSAAGVSAARPRLSVTNVKLSLTSEAAGALNSIFGVSAFQKGAAVGVASVSAITVLLPAGTK